MVIEDTPFAQSSPDSDKPARHANLGFDACGGRQSTLVDHEGISTGRPTDTTPNAQTVNIHLAFTLQQREFSRIASYRTNGL